MQIHHDHVRAKGRKREAENGLFRRPDAGDCDILFLRNLAYVFDRKVQQAWLFQRNTRGYRYEEV